ncbi:MAG: DUF6291 domain-containing protein [Oscillospiraceae bacterium]|jgi:hypothetical protein|nr:DUF6291 domain-containing protein [Oscillospiraceae bacterium]
MAQPHKNSFVLYADLLDKLERLTNEQIGMVFKAILEFENGLEPVIADPLAQLSFDFIKPDLIKNNEKYQEAVKRSRENGAKGGRPRKENPQNPAGFNETKQDNQKSSGLNQNPEKHDNDNGNENDRKNITAGAVADFYDKFKPPKTLSPVRQWQTEAARLADYFKLDLDVTFTKPKSHKAYKIADSWYRLFRDGGDLVVGRLETAYSYFADQERFLALPDATKWGYLRDIAHNGLAKFKQKGVYNAT